MTKIKLGPLLLTYLPDADDPGTGVLRVSTESGYEGDTPIGLSYVEFLEAAKAVR